MMNVGLAAVLLILGMGSGESTELEIHIQSFDRGVPITLVVSSSGRSAAASTSVRLEPLFGPELVQGIKVYSEKSILLAEFHEVLRATQAAASIAPPTLDSSPSRTQVKLRSRRKAREFWVYPTVEQHRKLLHLLARLRDDSLLKRGYAVIGARLRLAKDRHR